MEKRIINPWRWQDERSYVQAVEVKNPNGTLYISGQAAIETDGTSSKADMRSQLLHAIENLEEVIAKAEYDLSGIVRLTLYTTSSEELFKHFDILQKWTKDNQIKQTLSMIEVNALFETLSVELEATVGVFRK